MRYINILFAIFILSSVNIPSLNGQEHSIAREWNEMLLFCIRNDLARPTVHARNLYHMSAAMYDAWAAYDEVAKTHYLGNEINGQLVPFEGIIPPEDVQLAREEAISYAAYRLLEYRFDNSIGARVILDSLDNFFLSLGYDKNYKSTDYTNEGPAAFGNYIADWIIEIGKTDGSNEFIDYESFDYFPVNDPLAPKLPGNPDIEFPNRWQPLSLDVFIDQAGNVIPFNTPPFLSPEWGKVVPFSLTEEDLTIHERDGQEYWVYHDPGPPPFIGEEHDIKSNEEYKWGFCMVAAWSSHLDSSDQVMWDISPASIGNIQQFPASAEEYPDFYDFENGGDISTGRDINPVTGEPYEPQMVKRADYARILAEFWADGPDSETPPGHWFTILNYVNDHPLLIKKFEGEGEELDNLEWDVKTYLTLGGAMHDVAISAWGVKGYYDYVRPVSAIRYMADQGQSTDPELPHYDPNGIMLSEGLIELVTEEDTLEGFMPEDINKIKLNAWRGPDYIEDPESDAAGADWILAENWWPYQRPTFVTPNFAGYVSGHSTYSRAAAEVLTMFTGDEYFPGGMGEFYAPQNEFLVFEQGPTQDITLQWATYRDASDQCSLSRIWGGIHPPADDIPGRKMGISIGIDAFEFAKNLFIGETSSDHPISLSKIEAYPNPVTENGITQIVHPESVSQVNISLFDITGKLVYQNTLNQVQAGSKFVIYLNELQTGTYIMKYQSPKTNATGRILKI